MKLSQAISYLPDIRQYTTELCITGGEPFLYHREIVELASRARGIGLNVSVGTGAGWVQKEETARRKLQAIADAGVHLIGISWDVYHAEQVPITRAVTVARLATALGMAVALRVTVPANGTPEQYEQAFNGIPVMFTRSPTLRLGQARHLPDEEFNITYGIPMGKCNVVLHPNIEPDGRVYACCGPARLSAPNSHLVLGDTRVEPLRDIMFRSVNDPVLKIINQRGPQFLYRLTEDVNFSTTMPPARPKYTSICELCMDMTKSRAVVSALEERLQDIDTMIILENAPR